MKDINLEELGRDLVQMALKAGADQADVYIQLERESEIGVRMGKVENLKEAYSQGLGLRVFKEKRLGFSHSSDFSPAALHKMVEQTVALAAESSVDEFNGLPEPSNQKHLPDLDLYDPAIEKIPTSWKIDTCLKTEQATFDFDKRITNSEGAGFFDGESQAAIANSFGEYHAYRSTYCYLIARPIAGQNGKLQSGYWFSLKHFIGELEPPEKVAQIAAERTLRSLGAVIPKTAKVPVVFDNITGAALLGNLLRALDGGAMLKGASFLTGKLNTPVASPLVTIIDDGTIMRGLASTPFDGEGLPTSKKNVISSGVLELYLHDSYSGRKSHSPATANAHREYSSLPSIGPLNFYLQSGQSNLTDIIGSIKSGLLLTSLMGFGSNAVTGDYSLGGAGIWIENGRFSYPVEGITVAANMIDILKGIDMVGNDLLFLGPVSSPSFRVREMTVSGM